MPSALRETLQDFGVKLWQRRMAISELKSLLEFISSNQELIYSRLSKINPTSGESVTKVIEGIWRAGNETASQEAS